MNIRNHKIVLASASPRRRELLERIGLEFEVIPSTGEEKITEKEPCRVVMQLSAEKAEEAAGKCEYGTVIIGADTVVAADGCILGKPGNTADAVRMLKLIEGRSHSVYTGVTIIYHGEKEDVINTFFRETRVFVYHMTDEEITAYAESGEADDKAGAYGIQGSFCEYVSHIEGDYNNVVGLPVSALMQEARKMNIIGG